MKKVFFIIFVFAVMSIANSVAQVTIGTLDTPDATLDVRSHAASAGSPDGILAPKLTGDQLAGKNSAAYGADQNGVLVYVTAAASAANLTGRNVNLKSPGFYYFQYDAVTPANSVWVPVGKSKSDWFYMPPSFIDTAPGTGKSINLFDRYKASVEGAITSGTTNFSDINPVGAATDYDYYVVGYDATVFGNIKIDAATGIMTYDITGRATDGAYITIILVRK